MKPRFPDFRLHALSPPEVIHISRLSQLPVPEVIDRLIAAGLDSIPGGGAEILVDRVRRILNCYNKATADEWLDVMRHAHRAGLRTTATMMYGTVETLEERLEHLFRLRELQDETGGFTAFIAWSYQPQHTELGGTEATGVEYLRTLAIARLVLDNFDNLQASWVTQGGKVGQLSLAYGANDMGSVMIEENVVRAAGAEYCMDEFEVVRNIESAGFVAKRRNMHYEMLGEPVFRERDVPAHARAGRGAGRRTRRAKPRTCAATRRGARPRAAHGRRKRASCSCNACAEASVAMQSSFRVAARVADCPIQTADRRDSSRRWVCRSTARRSTAAGSRSPTAASRVSARAAARAVRGSRRRRAPAGPGQRAHASRTELDGRARAAGGLDGRVDSDADARAPRRAAGRRRRPARRDARRARRTMRAHGTVLVGDISNTLLSPPVLRERRPRRRRVPRAARV